MPECYTFTLLHTYNVLLCSLVFICNIKCGKIVMFLEVLKSLEIFTRLVPFWWTQFPDMK